MYKEKEKDIVRNRLLSKAISDLTDKRRKSYMLNIDEVKYTYYWAFEYLERINFINSVSLRELKIDDKINNWISEHRSSYENRDSRELKILYLCGPNPSNDLSVFKKHNIIPQNVWAVESKKDIYNNAVNELNDKGYYIRIIREELAKFLNTNNVIFDIIYFDACGPLCGGKPDTLNPIIETFSKERLSPLSAIITNFSEVKDTIDFHSGIIAAYFMGRYNDYPESIKKSGYDPEELKYDGKKLKKIVQSNIDEFYSDFITRFIIDLARYLIPNCRALSEKMIWDDILNIEKVKEKILKKSFKEYKIQFEEGEPKNLYNIFKKIDDWDLSPDSYPFYTFLKNQPTLSNSPAFSDKLKNIKINGRSLNELIPIVSVLNKIIEGHWEVLSEKFLKTILNSWFDNNGGIFCDVPLPNIAVNAHLGSYGRPYHVNTKLIDRLSYKAKSTRMYADYFLLDNCSEFFNWYPSVDQAINFFTDFRNQILARSMIDRLGRFDWLSTSHPFRGSALAGFSENKIAKSYEICDRINLN
jgi:hypothetical protein